VNPSKRQEPREEITSPPAENDKENADSNDKTERVCYETKIIGGVVVKTPVRKVQIDRCLFVLNEEIGYETLSDWLGEWARREC